MVYKEFRCNVCGKVFETLLREGETPKCPACGSEDAGTNFSGGVCNKPAKHCSGNCKSCGGCH